MKIRLINTSTMVMEEFFDARIPKYAILSHTWEQDEISHQEYMCLHPPTNFTTFSEWTLLSRLLKDKDRQQISAKAGYRKIEEAIQKARSNHYEWIWVDTCCIDKRSSEELSEALNSMFKFYQYAKVCYALLSDYDVSEAPEQELDGCKWFTRGWTLQELIAPSQVVFFDKKWRPVGRKTEMTEKLSHITKIQRYVLKDPESLGYWSVAQRMCWASSRQVAREEDIAYCLLGIFNVNMPLLYGEGGVKAFKRLQKEILMKTNDHSLFAWTGPADLFPHRTSILASSPRLFADCERVRHHDATFSRPCPSSLTSGGVQITLRVRKRDANSIQLEALLDCYFRPHRESDPKKGIVIDLLGNVSYSNTYYRYMARRTLIDKDAQAGFELKNINIQLEPTA